MEFTAKENPILKNEILIYQGCEIRMRLNSADFESDKDLKRFISVLLQKLNS